MDTLIIGIGNKARTGKDTCANYLKKLAPDAIIMHWADPLKEEVINQKREFPLIKQYNINGAFMYELLSECKGRWCKQIYYDTEVPFLDDIFFKRNITEYWGMDEKDSEMLQFWGTDFRRTFCSKDYWINLTLDKIAELKPKFVIIPDTRFKNEYDAIKRLGGYYIQMVRTDFIANDRKNSHISETELDSISPDYTIEAKNGDLETIEMMTKHIYNSLT